MVGEGDVPVITIDGPSGSGKGTIGGRLAQLLGWHFLDSGSVYRALALAITWEGLEDAEPSKICEVAERLQVNWRYSPAGEMGVFLGEVDISKEIRSSPCAELASRIARFPEVRIALVKCQRACRRAPGLVADGRDMGTVIFPDARCKFFLVAEIQERARRRLLQLQELGINANLNSVYRELAVRDERDRRRSSSPLKPDPAAVIINTTRLTVDEVMQRVQEHVTGMQI